MHNEDNAHVDIYLMLSGMMGMIRNDAKYKAVDFKAGDECEVIRKRVMRNKLIVHKLLSRCSKDR